MKLFQMANVTQLFCITDDGFPILWMVIDSNIEMDWWGKEVNFGKKGSPLQFRNHPRLHEEKHQETENTEFHCYYFYIHGVYLYNRKLHQICLI